MDEIIFAYDHDLKVNKHQHGADMFDKSGNAVEHKGSVCTKANKHTAHFNWPIPLGTQNWWCLLKKKRFPNPHPR